MNDRSFATMMKTILTVALAFSALSLCSGVPSASPQPKLMAASTPPSGREAVRKLCEKDVAAFCPDAAGNPFKLMPCMANNAARLQPACRKALQDEGLIPK